MAILNFKKYDHIQSSHDDDFIYVQLINLFNQLKTIQGATELNYTLRNHWRLRDYCIKKQIDKIKYIEDTYFNDDGSLKTYALEDSLLKEASLQNV